MPRKTRRTAAPAAAKTPVRSSSWIGYLLTALISVALSVTITLLVMRHHTPNSSALALGNTYFDQQNWPMAVEYYQKAIDSGIDNPDVHTDLGTAYRNLNQPQQALAQYQIAQRENPRHENSLFNQGVIYLVLLNNPPKAVSVWQEYIQRFPSGQHTQEAQHLIAEVRQNPGNITGNPTGLPSRH